MYQIPRRRCTTVHQSGRVLRSMLRQEQQTVRMALATALHHSYGKAHAEHGAQRGLKTATRAGEEGHEDKHHAPRRQKPPPPQPELFQLYEEEPGGGQPAPPPEVAGWQSRVQRRTVEQIADLALMVQILNAPVPQVVDQLIDHFKAPDTAIPEQVIAVPKFSQDSIPPGTVLSKPQMAEQDAKSSKI